MSIPSERYSLTPFDEDDRRCMADVSRFSPPHDRSVITAGEKT